VHLLALFCFYIRKFAVNPDSINRIDDTTSNQRFSQNDKEPPSKFNTSTHLDYWKYIKKPKILISLIVLVVSIIAAVVVIQIIKSNNKNEVTTLEPTFSTESSSSSESSTHSDLIPTTDPPTNEPTNETPTNQPTIGPPTAAPTNQPPTTPPSTPKPTTTDNPQIPFEIVPKSAWNASEIKSTAMKIPVERVIVFETVTDQCTERQSCLNFLLQKQKSIVDRYINGIFIVDMMENYLVGSDGTVYEARGFLEGQHTYDDGKTSHNFKALGINFAVEHSDDLLNSRQIKALESLTEYFSSDEKLIDDFHLFHRTQLIGGNETAISDQTRTLRQWRESTSLILSCFNTLIAKFQHQISSDEVNGEQLKSQDLFRFFDSIDQ
jgi:hypothetical protein